ncbi:MAG: pyridoxal-phosphate dependent enzyme [Bacilli bacterium]|jgi:1-aminocyclopropane-1-carboxylate deaminase/D-cysteine desulfhydrase-like pyridoxal-dependent ACC family enzyme|nr:pyridoxal-phosphate dependent enzyme [Bacilli bacterium]
MEEFTRVEVGRINTPIEYLENLSKYFNKGDIFIKRDDLTGLAMGGNKTRKLDYIIKYALDHNYTTLLTYGAAQTNHGRLSIAGANKFGLKSILVVEGKKPPLLEGNLALDVMMDGEVIFIDNEGYSEEEYLKHKQEVVDNIIYERIQQNEKVLEIPMGGSNALGAYGYMQCIKEIVMDTKWDDINLDYLVCAYGSMGTYAGLVLGAKYYKTDFVVVGIPVFPEPFPAEDCVKLANELAQELDIDIEVTLDDLLILGGMSNNKYAGPAYGETNQEIRDAMYLMAQKESIILDPAYTGKMFYGFTSLIKENYFSNSNVLLLHTGGYPGLFVDKHIKNITKDLGHKVKQF